MNMNLIMLIGLVLPTGSDWKSIAGDRQRTGRTPAVGQIQTPRLTWQVDTAARDIFATVTPSGEDSRLEVQVPTSLSPLSDEARERWGLAPSKIDVGGDGQMRVPPTAPGARWGKFLPDVPGFQRLSWTTTWGENAHFQLHSFEGGMDAPRLIWDVPFEGAMYSPLVVVVDIDSDGKQEAVLSTWHGVVAYNLVTGAEKYRSMYREGHGRQYGFFGAYTDAAGRTYLVVIGDFAGHIGVLTFRDGQLKALWSHLFDPQSEQGIDRRYTINTVGPEPIGDFDGDGCGEVLINVFNETGDGRWHLLAYDLETGEHRLDLLDVYLHGHADVDGDGRVEVLTVQENRDGGSRIMAINLDGEVRWHYDFPDFGGRAPIWNECGTTIWSVGHFFDGRRIGVLVSNRRSIMHSDETVIIDPQTDQCVWHRDVLEVRQPWTDTQWPHTRGYGGGAVALAAFDDGLDDIVLCYPAEYSVVKGTTGEQLIVESTGPLKGTDGFWVFSGHPLVADLDGDGRSETVWTSPSMILAFAHRNGRAEVLWRTEPDDGTNALPAIADVDTDGHLEIGVPGCQDGFRCLDGATGNVQWTIPGRGDSTSNCVAADIDGDGIEEFIYADGSELLATGREGRVKWEYDLPAPIEYIAVADVYGDGSVEILASSRNGVVYCIE